MDTGGDWPDASMTAFISFPQVLGHEVVGDVSELRPGGARSRRRPACAVAVLAVVRARVASRRCARRAKPATTRCAGTSSTAGSRPASTSATRPTRPAASASCVPAHASMAIPIPDDITDEVAVLADPFAVALHSITRTPPPPGGGKVVVWGAGALGTSAIAVLRALYPSVEVCVVARTAAQQELAHKLGAHARRARRNKSPKVIVEALAEWSGGVLRKPWGGLPIAHPAFVDVVYDTIGTPTTIEQALRVMKPRGSISITGVNAPGRFEWSPWYFNEIRIVGSNAFGDRGGRRRPQARDRALPRHRARRPHRHLADAHAHVPARRMARCVHDHRPPRRHRRDQSRLRLPMTARASLLPAAARGARLRARRPDRAADGQLRLPRSATARPARRSRSIPRTASRARRASSAPTACGSPACSSRTTTPTTSAASSAAGRSRASPSCSRRRASTPRFTCRPTKRSACSASPAAPTPISSSHESGDVVDVGAIPITLIHTPGTRRDRSASSSTAGS